MPDGAWPIEVSSRIARGERAVLVTMARASGSTPREAGAAMVVGAHDLAGTIGGGHLEFEATRVARDALQSGQKPSPWLVRFPLAARLGQCCGGVATHAFRIVDASDAPWIEEAAAKLREGLSPTIVTRIGSDDFVQTVSPIDFHVLIFGNGHIGRGLAQVFGALTARVRWIDAREEDFPAQAAGNLEMIVSDIPEAELRDAPAGSFVVITTHDHALDLRLIEAALARDDWRYLGLIGSVSKRNQFEKRLMARGFSPQQIAQITCPIGRAPGLQIRSKEPGAIAVAVAAEILALRESSVRLDLPQSALS
jgi:xanthine dehydrogenase accessory factor